MMSKLPDRQSCCWRAHNAHVTQNHVDYEARGRVLAEQQGTIETLTKEVERLSADSDARLRGIFEQQEANGALTRDLERLTAMIESLRQHAAELTTARRRLDQRRVIRLLHAFRLLPRE
jgi:hypothetical protein